MCSGLSSHTLQMNITLFLLPAGPAHSAVFSSAGAKHTEKLKPLCWEAGLWESGTGHSEDIHVQRAELHFY